MLGIVADVVSVVAPLVLLGVFMAMLKRFHAEDTARMKEKIAAARAETERIKAEVWRRHKESLRALEEMQAKLAPKMSRREAALVALVERGATEAERTAATVALRKLRSRASNSVDDRS